MSHVNIQLNPNLVIHDMAKHLNQERDSIIEGLSLKEEEGLSEELKVEEQIAIASGADKQQVEEIEEAKQLAVEELLKVVDS